jgi:starch synthase
MVDEGAGLKVLHVAAELYPWAKTGGLGDVTAALPRALAGCGVDARLLLPGLAGFLDAFPGLAEVGRLRTPFAAERVRLARAMPPAAGSRPLYLVDHPAFYDRPGNPYGGADGRDWPDNYRRFGLLGWVAAALAAGADPDWRPDIVHAHDWHAGLAPAYLAAGAAPVGRAASVFTVHNLALQGLFPAAAFAELGLPAGFFAIDGLEFYGQVSFLKAGLYYADRLTTVSPTYAAEIQTPEFGAGLDGLLRRRAAALGGILNGVDQDLWDPGRDPVLPLPYGAADVAAGKHAARTALAGRVGLVLDPAAPLFGVVSRLTQQKGLDLLLAALPGLVAQGGGLALLGSGDAALEQGFTAAEANYRGQVGVVLGYDEALSHLVIAGADVIVVPSRFEPCGLTQLYALRYGSLPLVRRVGGLADTVVDATAVSLADGSATGFAFGDASPAALAAAIARAAALFRQKEVWRRMTAQAMSRDFSWNAAARRYADLYRSLARAPSR